MSLKAICSALLSTISLWFNSIGCKEWGQHQQSHFLTPELYTGSQDQCCYSFTHSTFCFPIKLTTSSLVLEKPQPWIPQLSLFLFVTTCYLNYSSSSGIKQLDYEHKAKSWPRGGRCQYSPMPRMPTLDSRLYHNPKVLYSFPCPLCTIIFLSCKQTTDQR